jgi:hypothetical protein
MIVGEIGLSSMEQFMKNIKKEADKKKIYTERTLDQLEKKIPELARVATREARANAIQRGCSLMQAIGGRLYEIFPDGTKKIIKKMEPNRHVAFNRTLHLKLK